MSGLIDALLGLVRGVLRLAIGLLLGLLALGLMLVVGVLMLLFTLWARLTGRQPSMPIYVARMRRTSARWSRGESAAAASDDQVVDVQARELPDDERPPR